MHAARPLTSLPLPSRHSGERASSCASGVLRPQARMFIPPPSNPNAKLGFSTYAMWALCVVVVGVCYKLEQNELSARPVGPAGIPDTVQKVMPSGAWLMSAPRPSAPIVVIPLMRHTVVVGRGRLDPEGQLTAPSCYAAIRRVPLHGLGCAPPG